MCPHNFGTTLKIDIMSHVSSLGFKPCINAGAFHTWSRFAFNQLPLLETNYFYVLWSLHLPDFCWLLFKIRSNKIFSVLWLKAYNFIQGTSNKIHQHAFYIQLHAFWLNFLVKRTKLVHYIKVLLLPSIPFGSFSLCTTPKEVGLLSLFYTFALNIQVGVFGVLIQISFFKV